MVKLCEQQFRKPHLKEVSEWSEEAEKALRMPRAGGAKRTLVWGKKVTAIHKSLLKRAASASQESLKKQHYYVCEACGFIALAEDAPERCLICKAPALGFTKVAEEDDMHAARNVLLCTIDCLCLFICPIGATDTEDGQIDF